jgi:hypothetical protein
MRSIAKKPINTNKRLKDVRTKTIRNVSPVKGGQRKEAAVVTLIIITVCYLVSHLPIFSYTLLTGFVAVNYSDKLETKMTGIHPIQLIDLLYHIQLTNAGLNATIYILRCGQMKTFFKMKLTKTFARYVRRES